MPQAYNPSGQDWDAVNVGRSTLGGAGGPKVTVPKTARQLDAAKAAGLVATEKRFGAGGNKSAHTATPLSAKKLEEADDVGTLVKVDKSLSKALMQARTAKGLTQKDLATAINEKPQVVAEYESGKAIPNPAIIAKLERKLGVQLPRPGKSKAPTPTATTSSTSTAARTTTGTGAAVKKTNVSGLTPQQAAMTRGGPPKRR